MVCPAPVITVKKALVDESELEVLLDDGAPRENISRFLRNRGFVFREERSGSGWLVKIGGESVATPADMKSDIRKGGGRTLLITSDRLGDGQPELGALLMKNFIHTLLETKELPSDIFFMNSGVVLAIEGSESYEALEKLHGMGVGIFSCGLCLDFMGIKDKKRVGETTNMFTAVETLFSSSQVIRL